MAIDDEDWQPGDEKEYDKLVKDYAAAQAPKTTAKDTIAGNKTDIQQFLNWFADREEELDELDDLTLKAYIGWLKEDYPQNTALKKVNSATAFFGWLEEQGRIEQNPRDNVEISDYLNRGYTVKQDELRAREGVVWLTMDEFQQVLEHVPTPRTRNELLLRLAFQTGLRASEIVDIRYESDMYPDERRIEVATAKQDGTEIRDVWWQPSLDLLLNRYLESDRGAFGYSDESPYLFCSNYGPDLSPNRPNRIFKQAVESAGLQESIMVDAGGHERKKYTFHCLRHSFAVHFVKDHGDGGGDIRSLQQLLGHSSIDVTEKYLRFADETLRDKQMRHGPS